MGRQNSREAFTNKVTKVAERLPTALKDTRKRSVFERIAKGDDTNNPVLDRARKSVGGDVGDLGSLTVEKNMSAVTHNFSEHLRTCSQK